MHNAVLLSQSPYLMSATSDIHFLVGSIIFGVSLLAVSFPGLSKQFTFLHIPHIIFFVGKHSGTGVILATAFLHLLPDAFQSLNEQDVKARYPAFSRSAGGIILVSLLAIFIIEYVSTVYVDHLQSMVSAPPSQSRFSSPAPSKLPSTSVKAIIVSTEATPLLSSPISNNHPRHQSLPHSDHPHSHPHPPTHHAHPPRNLSHTQAARLIENDVLANCPQLLHAGILRCACLVYIDNRPGTSPSTCIVCFEDSKPSTLNASNTQEIDRRSTDAESGLNTRTINSGSSIGRRRQVVGILVLQLGIMIHSFVIGLTLVVTSGSNFTSLATAILFHQLFEGFSLGIRIAALPPAGQDSENFEDYRTGEEQSYIRDEGDHDSIIQTPRATSTTIPQNNAPKRHILSAFPFKILISKLFGLGPVLSFLFSMTTPLGMAIGSLLFNNTGSSRPAAQMHLIQGLLSAISSGMLVYVATVEMIAGDFVFGDVGGGHGHGHGGGGHDDNSDDKHEPPASSPLRLKVLAMLSLLGGGFGMVLIAMAE